MSNKKELAFTNEALENFYLDYSNNYITVKVMAIDYGLDEYVTNRLIEAGRSIHNKPKPLKFYVSSDNVDMQAKSIGLFASNTGRDNRALCIQIKHNGDEMLYSVANKMARVIAKALNDERLLVEKIGHIEVPF